jgi:hypothetical protein
MLKTNLASKNVRWIAFMRVIACSISSRMNAWTAVPANQYVQLKQFIMRMMFLEFGKSLAQSTQNFFVEIGSPGGASKVGATGSDHQIVAALPPKSE